MIDQNIIDASTKTAKLALINCGPTDSPELFTVNNVFDAGLVDKLREYLSQNQINWKKGESSPGRKALAWEGDTVVEEMNNVCNNLTELISEKFFGEPINFLGCEIWKDQGRFAMTWHSDNPIINVALQIYMFDSPSSYGTSFLINDVQTPIPHIHNTGYLVVTKSQPGIVHKPTSKIPAKTKRYSVYAVWSLTKKIINEETTC